MLEYEANRERQGADPRDLSSYSEWRDEAPDEVVDGINLYSTYLVGQLAGTGEALCLNAIKIALEVDEVPRGEWSENIHRLNLIHNETMRIMKRKQKAKERRNG